MNEQFTKTLNALEAAEKEMAGLHNTLDGLEIVNRASWHESETAARFRRELCGMTSSVTAMLEKREKSLLEGVCAQHKMQSTNGGQSASDNLSKPTTISG